MGLYQDALEEYSKLDDYLEDREAISKIIESLIELESYEEAYRLMGKSILAEKTNLTIKVVF